MKEIGGYIEYDRFTGSMLYEDGVKLNCGRNALAYLIEAKGIKKIYMPYFNCDSCNKILKEYGVGTKYYHIDEKFKPIIDKIGDDEWIYIINYYGQLTESDILYYQNLYKNIIIDNAQAYFCQHLDGVDTIYSCRKFFGVADGAILYTNVLLNRSLQYDESFERMHFLLGRYERSGQEFYGEYVANNRLFEEEPLKKMSRLTENILHGIDYEQINQVRTQNFIFLDKQLNKMNMIKLHVPKGAYMYPLYIENGGEIRRKLHERKIFVPTLWPNVLETLDKNSREYDWAKNILPLPVDQRYGQDDMEYLVAEITKIVCA